MANILSYVVNNYNEVLENTKDPEVDSWPLMRSPVPLISILGAYLFFVLKLGPKLMEKRAPFQLKKLMIAYNLGQVLFSIWLAYMTAKLHLDVNVLDAKARNGKIDEPKHTAISGAAWWYFFAKIIELLDTVFFVLRKKQNQVSFLHVYHHTTVALFSWCYLKYLPGAQGVFISFLNCCVHVVMYTYYLIAALGPSFKKYLWWKKYMTTIQLIQFGIMFCYLITILMVDSGVPKALTYFLLANVLIFLYLFSDFYRKAYRKKID